MKIAETVTFGGSGLERHAELRGTQDASPAQGDLAVLVWRGKIFMDIDPTKGLALIDAGERAEEALERLRSCMACAVETDEQMAWATSGLIKNVEV